MTATDSRVGVVVLNWNSAWLTARCVRALQATVYPADRLEIVVADNASIDGSFERLRHDLSGVSYLANEANLGFAEGCNRAIRSLDEVDVVALVNNDAVVSPGWLRPLVDTLTADPRCGAACPKMLLETPFVDVSVDPASEPARLLRISANGIDVTGRCVMDGVDVRVDPVLPWSFVRHVDGPATISVPVGTQGPSRIEVAFDGRRPDLVVDVPPGAPILRRINCAGTDLTAWGEGFERRFGELDRDDLRVEEVNGWSGGGVALRRSMLDEIGLFDPGFFAYYEDTDLAWRSRRAGWHTTFVPESVVDHLHGGSGGAASGVFFFLNYRNWLWTNLRNGDLGQIVRASRRAWHYSWPYTRRNVVGRVRRLQRPDTTITAAWFRIAAGVMGGIGPLLASRRSGRSGHPVGVEPTTAVRSRWMPTSSIPTPRHWPGGPRLVYVDVSETLRSGWRAGIQRVTCQVVAHLPADERLHLVPLVWSPLHGRFRRVTGPETASLFEPTGAQQPRPPGRPQATWRRRVGRVGRLLGLSWFARAGRRKRALAAEPAVHRELLLDRLEPGAVFFDLDAAWNLNDVDAAIRFEVLDSAGVTIVQHLYDMLPIDRPEWFEPNNARLFARHVEAHRRRADLVIANSRYTADAYLAWCARTSDPSPAIKVVALGADVAAISEDEIDDADPATGSDPHPYVLMVGTIEPRKNHDVVLDALELLRVRHPELRLVVIGRAGWRPGAAVERLGRADDDRVVWRTDVGDVELDALYRGALVVVAPSLSEGFGLPVVEALRRGVPVIASAAGALAEVGGDAVDRFDPTDPAALADLVARHLDDAAYGRRMRERAVNSPDRSWAAVASEMADLLVAVPARSPAARQSPL